MKFIRPMKVATLGIVIALLVSGCATVHKSLKPDLLNKKRDITVYSFIPHDKVIVHHLAQQSVVTGPGLIGALVGAAVSAAVNTAVASNRQQKINEKLIPVQKAANGFDFRADFWGKLDPVMSGATWFNAVALEKRPALSTTEKDNFKSPVLILESFYELSVTFQVLTVQTKARLFLDSLETPDFFASYTYYSEKVGTKRTAHTLWAQNDAALLRRELRAGIDENMRMLQRELLQDPTNKTVENGRKIEFSTRHPLTWRPWVLKGVVLEESDSRLLVRETGGNLFSVAKSLGDE